MRTVTGLILGLAGLVAVGQAAPVVSPTYVDLGVFAVNFPSQVRPGELLTIKIAANGGGCVTYDRLTVERSPSRLDLRVQMRRPPTTTRPQTCTADAQVIQFRYVDDVYGQWPAKAGSAEPGLPPATPSSDGDSSRPLNIVVNGKSWGTVVVR